MTLEELFEPVPMLFGGGDIIYAKNGAKLENIEVSEEENVIPEGALHKNKHADFQLDTTKKGIPIITISDDNVQTLEQILALADSLQLHAEVESQEIIFNFNLTLFLEEKRKEFHKTEDPDILLEVGKRLTKEILENTKDETDLIEQIEEKL